MISPGIYESPEGDLCRVLGEAEFRPCHEGEGRTIVALQVRPCPDDKRHYPLYVSLEDGNLYIGTAHATVNKKAAVYVSLADGMLYYEDIHLFKLRYTAFGL